MIKRFELNDKFSSDRRALSVGVDNQRLMNGFGSFGSRQSSSDVKQ